MGRFWSLAGSSPARWIMEHLQGKRSIYVVEEGIKDYGAAAFLRSLGLEVYSLGVADPFVPAGTREQLLQLCHLDAEA